MTIDLPATLHDVTEHHDALVQFVYSAAGSTGLVENASYGLTNCAERVAIGVAVAAGAKRILAVGVTAAKLKPITPCGACRQVIREFADANAPVASDGLDGRIVVATAGELLPGAF